MTTSDHPTTSQDVELQRDEHLVLDAVELRWSSRSLGQLLRPAGPCRSPTFVGRIPFGSGDPRPLADRGRREPGPRVARQRAPIDPYRP